MTDLLTPPDPKPNSDQVHCENCLMCGMIVDELQVTETINGEGGCTECISRCRWCGNNYFNYDMFGDPYFGYTCEACQSGEEYRKALDQEIEKESLRCYFDSTTNKQIEQLIIEPTIRKGYFELAHELKGDL